MGGCGQGCDVVTCPFHTLTAAAGGQAASNKQQAAPEGLRCFLHSPLHISTARYPLLTTHHSPLTTHHPLSNTNHRQTVRLLIQLETERPGRQLLCFSWQIGRLQQRLRVLWWSTLKSRVWVPLSCCLPRTIIHSHLHLHLPTTTTTTLLPSLQTHLHLLLCLYTTLSLLYQLQQPTALELQLCEHPGVPEFIAAVVTPGYHSHHHHPTSNNKSTWPPTSL
jgi:hypothetical protein